MEFDGCVRCYGDDPKCSRCKGKNVTQISKCPGEEVDSESVQAVSMYRLFEEGILATGGGYFEQTKGYFQVMRLIGQRIFIYQKGKQNG